MNYAPLWLRRHPKCFRQMTEAYGMPSLREGPRISFFKWNSGVSGVSGK
jgi:hypothetical protein